MILFLFLILYTNKKINLKTNLKETTYYNKVTEIIIFKNLYKIIRMAEIYDMLKARHSVSLIPFILSNKLSELYQLCLEVPSAGYEPCI